MIVRASVLASYSSGMHLFPKKRSTFFILFFSAVLAGNALPKGTTSSLWVCIRAKARRAILDLGLVESLKPCYKKFSKMFGFTSRIPPFLKVLPRVKFAGGSLFFPLSFLQFLSPVPDKNWGSLSPIDQQGSDAQDLKTKRRKLMAKDSKQHWLPFLLGSFSNFNNCLILCSAIANSTCIWTLTLPRNFARLKPCTAFISANTVSTQGALFLILSCAFSVTRCWSTQSTSSVFVFLTMEGRFALQRNPW